MSVVWTSLWLVAVGSAQAPKLPTPDQALPALQVSALESPAPVDARHPWLDYGPGRAPSLSWTELHQGGTAAMAWSRLQQGAWTKPEEIARGDRWFVNWADHPLHAATGDGRAMAIWLRKVDAAPYAYHVQYRLRGEQGWGSVQRLHDDSTPTEHGFVSLEVLPEQGFAAVWLNGGGGPPMQLHGRVLPFDRPAGPERVLDPQVCDCCSTALRARDDGQLYALYRDRSSEEIRDMRFLQLQITAADDATPPAFGIQRQGSVHDDHWLMPACPVNGPALAIMPSARVAAWFTMGAEQKARVLLRSLPRPGALSLSLAAPTEVARGAEVLGRVALAPSSGGELLVCWLEKGSETGRWLAQSWAVRGGRLQARSRVTLVASVPSSRASGFLRLAPHPEGGWLAAWTEIESEQPGRSRVRLARVDKSAAQRR